jgi:hypothetical protein
VRHHQRHRLVLGRRLQWELGNGTSTNSGVPVAIDSGGALAGKVLTQTSSGYEHTCALDAAALSANLR